MYAKVFNSLWRGSMRGKSDVQLVFIYLLSHCDPDGYVEMVPEAIADDTGLGLERVTVCIAELAKDDPRSRSPEQNGRRIEPIDERGWGWRVVNYKYYRSLQDQEMVRAQTRIRVAKHRAKKAAVTLGNGPLRQEEGEVEGEVEAEKTKTLLVPVGTADADFDRLWKAYPHYGRRSSKATSRQRWLALRPRPSLAEVLAGLEASKSSADWLKDSGAFVPACEVWIRKRGWDSSDGSSDNQESRTARSKRRLRELEAERERESALA